MDAAKGPRRYPSGTGLLAGYAVGAAVGIGAWLLSGRVILGLILLVATGTALGVAFEQSGRRRPLTPRERRLAWLLLAVGALLAALLWVFAGSAGGTAALLLGG